MGFFEVLRGALQGDAHRLDNGVSSFKFNTYSLNKLSVQESPPCCHLCYP